MAKMFDKVSDSFLDAIKSVTEKKLTPAEMKKREEVAKAIERDNPDMPMDKKMAIATATAKKVAEAKLDPVDHKELKGSHADRKDKDIDNDGDVDTSDEYLHNRRKAVKKAMAKKMKEEAEQIDELTKKALSSYIKKAEPDADRLLDKGKEQGDSKSWKKGHQRLDNVNRAKDKWGADKRYIKVPATEETQIDEISPAMKSRYKTKARGDLEAAQSFQADLKHEGEPKSSRVSKDVAQIIKKRKAGLKRVGEEVEQVDEVSLDTLSSYMDKASDARRHRGLSTKKIDNRYKGVALAQKKGDAQAAKMQGKLKPIKTDYERQMDDSHRRIYGEEVELTPEEIEMIEAKMAGVADDALPGNEHMCATKVFHKEWKEGTPVPTMHADPDDEGLIEWYDVMFDHGIERVMTEDMEIISEMSHGHKKRGMKKEDVQHIDEGKLKDMVTKHMDAGHDYDTAVKKAQKELDAMKEEVEIAEARGRPKKAGQMDYTVHPKTKEKLMHNNPTHMRRIENLYRTGALKRPKTEAGQNIVTQLRKASTSMRGGETVNFTHGAAKHVSSDHARKLLDKHADMKPAEKEAFQKKIGHSHEEMKKHV